MRSLSLKAYSALARSDRRAPEQPRVPRPAGLLIWAVVPDDTSARAVIYLVERLRQLRGPCSVLLTLSSEAGDPPKIPKVVCDVLPEDTNAASAAFLQHWQPDVCLWIGGNLQPILIAQTDEACIPLFLLSADSKYLEQSFWRWLPGLARETVSRFAGATALTADTAKLLRKLSNGRCQPSVTPPLQITSQPATANQLTHEEVVTALGGRPVWLAARVQESEIGDVLAAHRATLRLTHRLLLVLVCADFAISLDARKRLAKQGWRVCHWEDGETIDENTQVVLVEDPDELGLWYRVSAVSFLASSLTPGHGGCDPYAAAALGTAIIYGPNVGSHMSSYTRLASNSAARIVNDSHGLAQAVALLLASDQSAIMAHAAWETISTGAQATDEALDLIQDTLDAQEALK